MIYRAKFHIIENTDEEGPIHLADVEAPVGMTGEEAQIIMSEAWDKFQESHPDTDSEFGQWLAEHHGFDEIEDEFMDFVVNE